MCGVGLGRRGECRCSCEASTWRSSSRPLVSRLQRQDMLLLRKLLLTLPTHQERGRGVVKDGERQDGEDGEVRCPAFETMTELSS